jgi:hypothetical protein
VSQERPTRLSLNSPCGTFPPPTPHPLGMPWQGALVPRESTLHFEEGL